MKANQRIIVQLTPDMKNYTWWIENVTNSDIHPPIQSSGNSTTSSTTLKNAIGAEMPTLAT